MRQKPILKYNGLTIVMSNQSRFDVSAQRAADAQKKNRTCLLTGNGGTFFNNECLQPETNVMQCDVRLKECREPLLPGTTCVLVLGQAAADAWIGADNLLGQIRGAPYLIGGIPHIASFFPQDAVDPQDYEGRFFAEEVAEDKLSAADEKSHHGRTSRKNYRFWLMKDTKRCLEIIKNGLPAPTQAVYEIRPNFDRICNFLLQTKNTDLFLDIETDSELHITCFAIATVDSPVYVVPLLTHTYAKAYDQTEQLLWCLAVAIRDNTLVAHNGAAFDFVVLSFRYGIPLGERLYDTMIAHHRCYPLVEKSLGHCTSLWTYEPFHKDESDFSYNSPDSCYRLWSYCGKDVHTMRLIKLAIDAAAKRVPGLADSIDQAMRSLRPYIMIMLQGIHYKQEKLDAIMRENDALMNHYIRWVPMLVGKDAMPYIQGSGKSSMLGSSPQAVRYFHDLLGYPIIAKSEKTGQPALGKKQLYKLRLKHENPMIDLCITFREIQHESGMLKFNPWKQAPTESLKLL